jgi:hypothetical protein
MLKKQLFCIIRSYQPELSIQICKNIYSYICLCTWCHYSVYNKNFYCMTCGIGCKYRYCDSYKSSILKIQRWTRLHKK